jgi:hypothetical protein
MILGCKNFWDKSTKILVISNVITIIFALVERWELITVLLIYWCQSVIIGYFNYQRILKLKKFTTKNLFVNGVPVSQTEKSKKEIANFFLLHYGFFHFVYLFFLIPQLILLLQSKYFYYNYQFLISLVPVVFSVVAFYFNHKTSFNLNYEEDLKGVVNIGTLMFMPYIRIVPITIAISLFEKSVNAVANSVSISTISVLFFFLIIKMVADIITHKIEHGVLRKSAATISEIS